ncbi:fibro-slime domain-containing protein [Sorangium cellulosum]|uniref:Fibro-slime domain-containing protein n=1 Tax=Sorangium cellulosum TaxID=56 RepID=A0A150QI55_SORCE|nr:fibro-slime domain-containing protein [Sorangium cellulosum]KYF67651.1 fibro-slime domain-containing protein [Sorangium cellulosum]
MMAYRRTMMAVSALVALVAATACAGGTDDASSDGAGTASGGDGTTSGGTTSGGDGTTSGGDFGEDPGDIGGSASSGGDPSAGGDACGSELIAIVRDFKDTHPDFEVRPGEDRGMVEAQLGADGKPVYAGGAEGTLTTSGKEAFDQWFRDVPDVNTAIQISISLTDNGNGTSTYDDTDFFPIDDMGFGNEERRHNYHFTLELHTTFEYKGGEVFTFSGDDDLFTFINGRLAIDLGGIHKPESATIDLDARAQELGITPGNTYALDFFFAERRTTESNFRIDTSIGCFTPVVN